MPIIYEAVNKINHKKYVGKTIKSLTERKIQHKSRSKKYNTYFYKAIRKYGFQNFHWNILCETTIELLNNEEIKFIKLFKTYDPKFGYNLTKGGDGSHGWTHTPEARKKIGNASKKLKGIKRSFETKQKISLSQKGKKLSEEHKRNISKGLYGNQNMKGKSHSNSTKKKMSNSHKNKLQSLEKRIKCSNSKIGSLNPQFYIIDFNIQKDIIKFFNKKLSIRKISKLTNTSCYKIKQILLKQNYIKE